jgi:hydroxyethylthiazole kinase-like uncharacterized protein yjeF
MGAADRLTAELGLFDGAMLMERAGAAIYAEILHRFPEAARIAVLCGPGNNGGDGYVVARLLAESGLVATVFSHAEPKPETDAARAAARCPVRTVPLAVFDPAGHDLVVDAVFGAGLAKPVTGPLAALFRQLADSGMPVVAVDLPSGVSGDSGAVLGAAPRAALTVTFFRKKPGHLLYPGRALCGEIVVADIGIPERVLETIAPQTFENGPALWRDELPRHEVRTHKYLRGAVAVFSGGPASTGAARLAARAAARAGAGAVTVVSPPSALMVNAARLGSVMVRAVGGTKDIDTFLQTGKTSAAVIGPGFGTGRKVRDFTLRLLDPKRSAGEDSRGLKGVVVDADALTGFAKKPQPLFDRIAATPANIVITPHAAEFARLFPDLAADAGLSKLGAARAAASRSGATVILKGPDTVIAAPDGRAAVNSNAPVSLATAGSGDVLAGVVAALLAQGMAAWEAACAAVWMHGEAGRMAGDGAMAEDIAEAIKAPVVGQPSGRETAHAP